MAPEINFNDTEIAFKSKSDGDLSFSIFIFKMMGKPFIVKVGTQLTLLALKLHLPIQGLIRKTIFRQFCGGETIKDCTEPFEYLKSNRIEAILDYSVEGQEREKDLDATQSELLQLIVNAKKYANDPTTCMKLTGLVRFNILVKTNANEKLSDKETTEYERFHERVDEICKKAFEEGVKIYIDAEDSWVQDTIDSIAEEMMWKYNKKRAIVFTTVQLYRHDRLAYLKDLSQRCEKDGIVLGVKLVRGAYMEKERERAKEKKYRDPIQPDKASTDRDYNAALDWVVEHIEHLEVCAGTHNAQSCQHLSAKMKSAGLDKSHPHIYFSQLYGMSDNLSFILANSGYNVSKYLPYGPVKSTLPYLIRRAEENTSVAGQMSKELTLLISEKARRKSLNR